MDTMNLKIQCILLFFTFYVQGGLTGDYEAHLGASSLLQVRICLFASGVGEVTQPRGTEGPETAWSALNKTVP